MRRPMSAGHACGCGARSGRRGGGGAVWETGQGAERCACPAQIGAVPPAGRTPAQRGRQPLQFRSGQWAAAQWGRDGPGGGRWQPWGQSVWLCHDCFTVLLLHWSMFTFVIFDKWWVWLHVCDMQFISDIHTWANLSTTCWTMHTILSLSKRLTLFCVEYYCWSTDTCWVGRIIRGSETKEKWIHFIWVAN